MGTCTQNIYIYAGYVCVCVQILLRPTFVATFYAGTEEQGLFLQMVQVPAGQCLLISMQKDQFCLLCKKLEWSLSSALNFRRDVRPKTLPGADNVI